MTYCIISAIVVFALDRQLIDVHRSPLLWICIASSVGISQIISRKFCIKENSRELKAVIANVATSYFIIFVLVGVSKFVE